MQRQALDHGFGPFFDKGSRLLILGSFPSVKSREQGFYYGHPQNRFWSVMAALFCEATPKSLSEKKAFLSRNHVALYDVIERCSIVGSADSSVADVVPSSLEEILRKSHGGRAIPQASVPPATDRGATPSLHQSGQRRLDSAPSDRRLARKLCLRRDILNNQNKMKCSGAGTIQLRSLV